MPPKEDETLTVRDLYERFAMLIDNGFGDMKIRFTDGYLHKDDLCFDLGKNEMVIRGALYEIADFQLCAELNHDITVAMEKFKSAYAKRRQQT